MSARSWTSAPDTDEFIQQKWTRAQGLPQDTVYCLLQANDGNLWIGTDSGLARFDGYRFSPFGKFNAPFLGSPAVTALIEDDEETLWIATFGSGLLKQRGGKFTRFDSRSGLSSNYLWCLCQDRQGSLWAGSIGSGLMRTDRRGKWTSFSRSQGLPSDSIKTLFLDSRGLLWIGTERGVAKWNGSVFQTIGKESGLPAVHALAIAEESTGRLWVGTTQGIYVGENDSFSLHPGQDRKKLDTIRAILFRTDRSVWLATDEGMKTIRQGALAPLTRISFETSPMAMLQDREGAVFVGTSGSGLIRLRESPLQSITTREGLSKNYILGIFQDASGTVWVGTYGGGLNCLENGHWRQYSQGLGRKIENVYSLENDGNGGLWVGTGEGLFRFHDPTSFPPYTKSDFPNDAIISLVNGKDRTLWIGTYGSGLSTFRKGVFSPFPRAGKPFGNYILTLLEDRAGAIWVGTFGAGLGRIKNDFWQTFTVDDGLPGNDVYSLYEDSASNLWIGTDGGGLGVRRQGEFRTINSDQGLLENTIFHILEDDDQNLWMSGKRGIFRVAKNDIFELLAGRIRRLHCLEIGEEAGLKSSVCTGGFQPAGMKDREGRLWFPTLNGVVAIDPRRVRSAQAAYPLTLEAVFADNRFFDPRQSLTLSPGNHRLGFRYSLPLFHMAHQVSFRYRLHGFDREWVDAGVERTAAYPAVPRGRYRFEATASFMGNLVGRIESPPIVIQPHWRQTVWFYLLLAGVFIGIWLAVSAMVSRQKREAKYSASTFAPGLSPRYRRQLLEIMAREKPYLDAELNISGLSRRMDMPAKHLSQLINDSFQQNFNEFVNRFRIEECIRRMRDPSERENKLLKIAFECGFNSKSVFNVAFKKFMGKSPSRFRKEIDSIDIEKGAH